jgi:hypothetical protein
MLKQFDSGSAPVDGSQAAGQQAAPSLLDLSNVVAGISTMLQQFDSSASAAAGPGQAAEQEASLLYLSAVAAASNRSAAAEEGQAAAQEAATSLLDLPESALIHIAHLSKHSPGRCKHAWGHPLLAVSRECRAAVLSSLTKFTLKVHPDAKHPSAQFLHRACCQAPAGLHVALELPLFGNSLPIVLDSGIACQGWRRVRILEVGLLQGSSAP